MIHGEGGHDILLGQLGRDAISGDDGDDRLFGGEEKDTLDGGEGKDRVKQGDGDAPDKDVQEEMNGRLAHALNPWLEQLLSNLRAAQADLNGSASKPAQDDDDDDDGGHDHEPVNLAVATSEFSGWSVASADAPSGPKVDRSGFDRLAHQENSRRFVRW